MGWLIASLFCGIVVLGGLLSLMSGSMPESEKIPNIIIIIIFVYLSYYFMKRYRRRNQPNIKNKHNASNQNNINEEDEKIRKLEEGLPVIEQSPIYLKGDILHYIEPATLLITKNKVVGRTGKAGGISVRLAKGIYAKTGSYGGTPIYRDVNYKYDGQLAVTNNRILFIHPQKGFEIRLKDISLIDPYSDGVSIQTRNKAHSFILKEPRYFLELVKRILEDKKDALA